MVDVVIGYTVSSLSQNKARNKLFYDEKSNFQNSVTPLCGILASKRLRLVNYFQCEINAPRTDVSMFQRYFLTPRHVFTSDPLNFCEPHT